MISKSEGIRSNIQANLDYRRWQQELLEATRSYNQKKKELEEITHGSSLQGNIEVTEKGARELRDKKAKLAGARQTYRTQLLELQTELDDEKYRGIDELHRKKLIECNVTRQANDDLERYFQV